MKSEEFQQAHEEWKSGPKKINKSEQPRTWLISKSGYFFPLDGDSQSEIERLRGEGMECTAHDNMTSQGMSRLQQQVINSRPKRKK